MARIRTIKPEFFRSRSLARCSLAARVTFAGLWCEADDYGRGVADPRILKGSLWPLDDEVGWEQVDAHMGELEATGHIVRYEVEGDAFFEVVAWSDHQSSAYRRGKALHPDQDGVLHDEACKELQDARPDVLEGKGREGKGEEGTVPPNGEQPKSKRGRKKAAHPLPDGWEPSGATREWAKAEYPAHAKRAVLEAFRDHARATDRRQVDWDSAFRNWIRNDAKWSKPAAGREPARTYL